MIPIHSPLLSLPVLFCEDDLLGQRRVRIVSVNSDWEFTLDYKLVIDDFLYFPCVKFSKFEFWSHKRYRISFFFFFLKFFLSDTFTCPILGPLVPLFWISGDVSSGFQSQSGFCLICIAEANVMYISWDPPLVLHIANLLTDSIAGHWPGSYLAQGYYCVAAVSLEPAINRSWVPCANHSATRPGLRYRISWQNLIEHSM